MARRLLDTDELKEFTDNVTGELRFLSDAFEGELLSAALYMMRRRLSCHVNIGPLKDDGMRSLRQNGGCKCSAIASAI